MTSEKMREYTKKPVTITAIQLTPYTLAECSEFVGSDFLGKSANGIVIRTLEGQHHASYGDYIIRGVKGEHYPCKPDVFAMTYEPAEQAATRRALPDGFVAVPVDDMVNLHDILEEQIERTINAQEFTDEATRDAQKLLEASKAMLAARPGVGE